MPEAWSLVNHSASASGFQASQVLVFTTMGDYFLKKGDHFASTLEMAFPPPTNQSHMALLVRKTKRNEKTCFSQMKKVQKSPSWLCFHNKTEKFCFKLLDQRQQRNSSQN